jgi:hypothetical protein
MKASVRRQASSRRFLELLLLAVEEAVRRAFELDELVLDAREPEHPFELDVVLVADAPVGPALQGEDRSAHLRHERERPCRPSVEADRPRQLVVEGRGHPRVGAAEAEADREERRAVEGEQVPKAGSDVRHHLVRCELLEERHVVPLIRTLVDTRGAAEIIEGDRGVAAFGPSGARTPPS